MSISDEVLEFWRAKTEAATPGPWLANEVYRVVQTHSDEVPLAAVCRYGNIGPVPPSGDYSGVPIDHPENANAYFIATAREAMPALLGEVERLRATVDRVTLLYESGGKVATAGLVVATMVETADLSRALRGPST